VVSSLIFLMLEMCRRRHCFCRHPRECRNATSLPCAIPGLRRGDCKSGEPGTRFFLTIVLLCDTCPLTPSNRGPAHDGELGRSGGQACGCGVTCAALPGAQEETRGHYDPRASGKATCSMGTVRKRSSKGLRPAGCGRCSALYRQPHKLAHRAGQRPRLPLFPEGPVPPSQRRNRALAIACFP
jgi:hypothetical protein